MKSSNKQIQQLTMSTKFNIPLIPIVRQLSLTKKSITSTTELEVEIEIEVRICPETEEEIECRKMKYATISLAKTNKTLIADNSLIVEQLRRLVEHIEDQIRSSKNANDRKKHGFRLSSIKKGIELIELYPHEIRSGREIANQVKGIGKGISDRIDEILRTGTLSELEEVVGDGEISNRIIAELTTVTGIGPVKARELVDNFDLRGVQDLIEKWQTGVIKVGRHELTHHIEVGLRWYYDIKQKIPREEMNQYSSLIKNIVKSIDPQLKAQICGSYRRGKSQSSDIDVLLTHSSIMTEPDMTISPRKYLLEFLQILKKDNIIIDSLTDIGKSPTKYMGISRLPLEIEIQNAPIKMARRIDILFIPYESWAPALFYFTGSGPFNKLFRGIALQRGYTLNEKGIYSIDDKGERKNLIPTFSEEQIFDVVGVEYLRPEEREF